MKLTTKGLLKIVGDIVVNSPEYPLSETLDNWNRARCFDQDDFEGVVILTVEEAKVIFEVIEEARDFLWQRYQVPLTEDSQKKVDDFRKRIDQAESLRTQRN